MSTVTAPAPSTTPNQQQQQAAAPQPPPTSSSSSTSAVSSTTGAGTSSQQAAGVGKQIELDKIYQWINELCIPATRENALIELR